MATGQLMREAEDLAQHERDARTTLTLNDWLVRTYGPAYSLHVMRLPRFCSPRCCQLFRDRDAGTARAASCSPVSGHAVEDNRAKQTCEAAVAPPPARSRGEGRS